MTPEPEAEPSAPRVYATYTPKQMKMRPAITFAVDKLIPEGGLASLVGQPATYKSFVAFDLAACITTRGYWQDRDVLTGGALYISAEGGEGMGQRFRAWEKARNLEIPETFRVITDAPQLRNADDLAALLATARSVQEEIGVPLRLIVIDTLARTFDREENSNREMGEAIAAVDTLRRVTGAAVLIVHHLNKAGTSSRGAGVLLGALDAEITAERKEHSVTLKVTKAKDFGEGEPIMLTVRVVDLGDGKSSITLDKEIPSADGFKAEWKNIGMVLHDQFGDLGAAQSVWKKACVEMNFPDQTFNRACRALAEKGSILTPSAEKKSYGHKYQLTTHFYEAYGMDIPWWLRGCGPDGASATGQGEG